VLLVRADFFFAVSPKQKPKTRAFFAALALRA
jgi:hypothetical protein